MYLPDGSVKYRYVLVELAVALTALPVDNPSGATVLSIELKLPCVSIVSVINL